MRVESIEAHTVRVPRGGLWLRDGIEEGSWSHRGMGDTHPTPA
jgi:hypothetical protein